MIGMTAAGSRNCCFRTGAVQCGRPSGSRLAFRSHRADQYADSGLRDLDFRTAVSVFQRSGKRRDLLCGHCSGGQSALAHLWESFPDLRRISVGARNNSVNYGIMFIGFALAGFFGPTIMSSVYAADGLCTRERF